MIKAHEIQGVLALENSFNRVGLDHVLLVRVASTAVATAMLGGSREQIINAVSNAWIDGGALRTYRHAPNTGSRKSWAAGDATSRAVRLALFALKGEMGYPSALSAKTWGFQDVLFKSKPLHLAAGVRQLRHGERAVQDLAFRRSFTRRRRSRRAMTLHAADPATSSIAIERVDDRDAGARRCASSTRPGRSRIRRTAITASSTWSAIPLLFGRLTAADYEDEVARDPRVDALRAKMQVRENPDFHTEYYASGQALHRQCRAGVFQGRYVEPARRSRLSRSATASAAPRACRCFRRSSTQASPRTSEPSKPKPSRGCSPIAPRSRRCRSATSWRSW